ncbi:MAG: helix-turn-helix transcriptional regulator [Bacteroidetes bacterium]|nr:MAG: helix-turn-helix transcriptional regulator [Bacteroidota bacterium]
MGEQIKVEITGSISSLKQQNNTIEPILETVPKLLNDETNVVYEHTLLLQRVIDSNEALGLHSRKFVRLLEEVLFYDAHREKFLTLSHREKDVLLQMALGKSNKEIASVLFITVNTVETHRKNIKRKLEVTTFYEINKYARAFNLI